MLPERATLEDLLKSTTSPQAAVQALLGERQLWWKCCGEAFRADRSWLFDGRGEELRAWLDATAPHRAAGSVTSAAHAWLLARALSAAERPDGAHDEALTRLAEAWGRSGLLSAAATGGSARPSGYGLDGLAPSVAAGLRRVVDRIQDDRHGVARSDGPGSLLVIAALLMAGLEPRRRPVVRVPVVFGRSAGPAGPAGPDTPGQDTSEEVTSGEGVAGVLELREFRAGPAGLYPDPRSMAEVRSPNTQFADSLGQAWNAAVNAAGPRGEGRCVLWRLVLSDEPVPPARIEGPSLGAAFALGLRELLRYPPARRPSVAWIRGVFYGLRPRTAVTGALDDGGRLLRVADMDAKLLAARRRRLWLVAPEANRLDVAAASGSGEVRFAATLRQADRYARRLRTGRLAVAVLVLLASVTGVFAFEQRESARSQRQAALAGRITAEANRLRSTDPSLAAQLDLVAYRMMPGSDPYPNLIGDGNAILSAPLKAHRISTSSVAYGPDARTMVSSSLGGTVKLWNVTDPAHPTLLGEPLPNAGLDGVTFSPAGRILVTGGDDGSIRLWNVADPADPEILSRIRNARRPASQSAAFSPDGRTLATGVGGDTIRLWDITDPAHPTRLSSWSVDGKTGYQVSLAFSPDGRTLTSGGGGVIRLWDLTDPSHPPVLLEPSIAAEGVADPTFSPDGRTLAATDSAGRVWLWNIADPARPSLLPHYLPVPAGSGGSMAFSPDGRLLATDRGDHTIRLWNVADPANPAGLPQLLTVAGDISTLAFSPDGRTLAGGTGDGRIRMWSLPDRQLSGLATGTNALAFSPDGHVLATGDDNGMVTLWNVTDLAGPEVLGTARTGETEVYNLAFSPNGRTLVAGDNDGTVTRWDVTDPADPEAVGRPLPEVSAGGPLALSLDGRTLAAGIDSHTIEVWSLADPAHPTLPGRPLTDDMTIDSFAISFDGQAIATYNNGGTVKLWSTAHPTDPTHVDRAGVMQRIPSPLTFSPDGRTLAAGNGTTTLLWSLADPAHPTRVGELPGRSNVASLAFSPDGSVLAAGSEDGTIRFIDPERPTALSLPLTDHAGSVFALAFSHDGHTLASVATDQTVRLWNTDPDDAARWICATTRNLTPAQWERYVPGVPYEPPCPA